MRVEPRMLDGPADNTPLLDRCKSYPGRWYRGAWRRCSGGRSDGNDLRDISARWRALKRLAVQAHDQDREHEFFARELRSARFVTDWPVPVPFLAGRGWLGFFSFWAGILYGLFSNYGRSILLPASWWALGVIVAANFYLAQYQQFIASRPVSRPWGEMVAGAANTALLSEWWAGTKRPCFVTLSQISDEMFGPREGVKPQKIELIGLSPNLRDRTSANYEAFQLALRDGFLILYGDADTAHRTYGCLYGIELYSNSTPIAVVPPSVGFWSGLHKLYSAVMIFLFGLALRNMLKMK